MGTASEISTRVISIPMRLRSFQKRLAISPEERHGSQYLSDGTDLGVVFERQMQARSRSGKLGIHLDVSSPSRGLGRSFVDKARN